jgi:hypothetical protein
MDFRIYGKQVPYQARSTALSLPSINKLLTISMLHVILDLKQFLSHRPGVPIHFHQVAIYSPQAIALRKPVTRRMKEAGSRIEVAGVTVNRVMAPAVSRRSQQIESDSIHNRGGRRGEPQEELGADKSETIRSQDAREFPPLGVGFPGGVKLAMKFPLGADLVIL